MNNNICPICDSKDISIFLEIPQIPVYINLLWKTKEEALNVPRADMELGFCRECGHVYNFAFDPKLMDYTQDYENSLHFSPRFQQYAEELALSLVKKYKLYDKDVIEIGCGDGDFLALLCAMGNNRGLGFDPSHVSDLNSTSSENNITFIRDYYSDKYAKYKADLVCCRHVLEHIQYPREFLNTIRHAIGDRPDTAVFFEVPNALFTLRDLGIWDLIYEHCSYFTPQSLNRIFSTSGFQVKRKYETYEGQFLCIESLPSMSDLPDSVSLLSKLSKGDGLTDSVNKFADEFNRKILEWQFNLEETLNKKEKIVVWGAGSKGATFLNVNKLQNNIHYIVDINPRKQGMYVSGTGQKIVPPEFLKNYHPDVVLIMNPIYVEEIRQMIHQLNLSFEVRLVRT